MSKSQPIIGIPVNVRPLNADAGSGLIYHGVAENFLRPLVQLLGFQPLLIPGFVPQNFDVLLEICDGILLTGADSNIDPQHYGAQLEAPDAFLDPKRDALALSFIRAAVVANVPLLGICRGMQEINVAFGGTLVQQLHHRPNSLEHRGWRLFDTPEDRRAHHAHGMQVQAGGVLARLLPQHNFMVNSLHMQGIDQVGTGLIVEAVAPDDTVEAISVAGCEFALGVLWHPEWFFESNPVSTAIFNAFGAACRARATAR